MWKVINRHHLRYLWSANNSKTSFCSSCYSLSSIYLFLQLGSSCPAEEGWWVERFSSLWWWFWLGWQYAGFHQQLPKQSLQGISSPFPANLQIHWEMPRTTALLQVLLVDSSREVTSTTCFMNSTTGHRYFQKGRCTWATPNNVSFDTCTWLFHGVTSFLIKLLWQSSNCYYN